MNNQISLHQALKNSYASRDKQKKAFVNQGYVFDSDLSNNEHQVYFNPKDKKLLYTIKGTNPFSLKDVGTDLWLATGHLKDTNRYKEEKATLDKAKQRYKPSNTTVSGHSLGSSLGNYITGKDDKFVGLDGGFTIGQKTRANATNYRTSGDLVSYFGKNQKNVHTLDNPNLKTGIFPLDAYFSHNVDNIKKNNIFI